MSQQVQTTLTGSGLGADATGDWHFITSPELLLTCYDDDDFASGVTVEYDLSDEPLNEGQVDPNSPAPTQFAPLKDESGVTVSISESESNVHLTFVANKYRMRARTVGGDGSTNITSRINANYP